MYSILPHFVLGFHGCDETVASKVVARQDPHLIASKNEWDWLGHGIYFWEQNYQRALEWAQYLKNNPNKSGSKNKINNPSAVGAIINLGNCLNLLDGKSIDAVAAIYKDCKIVSNASGTPLPKNIKDARFLDCYVINMVNYYMQKMGGKKYDTVRGMFPEGRALYKNAGFKRQNHIQICVINHNCIKGYFHPMQPDGEYPTPLIN